MRNLTNIEKELENKVKEYLNSNGSEREDFFDVLDFEVAADGGTYSATIEVYAIFSLETHCETDIYGSRVYLGTDSNLDTFNFEIKDLWDYEKGEFIVEDYEITEKW